MSIKGSSYMRFRRALDTGNITLIRSAAAELPQVNLDDALKICLVLRKTEPDSYERAVVRWLGRFCIERRDLTLAGLRVALSAFERMPQAPEEAAAQLRQLAEP